MDLVDIDAETIDTNAAVIEENNTEENQTADAEDGETSESVPLFESFPEDETKSVSNGENKPIGTNEEMVTTITEAVTEEIEPVAEELNELSGSGETPAIDISTDETEYQNDKLESRDQDMEIVEAGEENQEEVLEEAETADDETVVDENDATEVGQSTTEGRSAVVVIDDEEAAGGGEQEQQKFSVFPLAKVKKIMKTDPDTHLIAKEAIMLTAKATELFLREFASFSYEALKETKRKTISKKEFDAVLELVEPYCFLDGIFYETAANEDKNDEVVEVQITNNENSSEETAENEQNVKSVEIDEDQNVKSTENQEDEILPGAEKENISAENEQVESAKEINMELDSISTNDVELTN